MGKDAEEAVTAARSNEPRKPAVPNDERRGTRQPINYEDQLIAAASSCTYRQKFILRRMYEHRDDDEGELVYERGKGYVGDFPVGWRTLSALLQLCAISLESDSEVGEFERYTINGTGKKIVESWREATR
jgi:hypothetical protein